MNTSPIQILASDYDGTLRKDGLVDPLDLQAIDQFRSQGNLFGIVTGRAYDMIVNELIHYGIDVDFLSCNNGSTIFDHEGYVIYQVNIDFNLACDLIKWLEKEDNVMFGACDGKHYFTILNGSFSTIMKNNLIGTITSSKEDIINTGTITAFFTRKSTDELTNDMGHRMEREFNYRLGLHTNGGTIDVGPKDITKSTAIQFLQKKYPNAHITTIGDHLNDMDMVKDFHGFAIASGHEELKKIASHIVSNLSEAIKFLT